MSDSQIAAVLVAGGVAWCFVAWFFGAFLVTMKTKKGQEVRDLLKELEDQERRRRRRGRCGR